jgi:polyisoprenoid-binding protein YceI
MENIVSFSTKKNLAVTDWLSEWSIDHKTSAIRFTAEQHSFLTRSNRPIEGTFKVYEGLIQANTEDFSGATIHMIIEADSINTGKRKRDRHLQSDQFLCVRQFPFLRFRSLSFEKARQNKYILEGELSVRGITRRVVLDVKYNPGVNSKTGEEKLCFECEFQINRQDYGLQSNMFFEVFIEKEITVQLDLQFSRLPGAIF